MEMSKKHIYLPRLKMCKPKETFKVPCTEVIIAEDENLVAIVSVLVNNEWLLLPARLYKVFGREIAVGQLKVKMPEKQKRICTIQKLGELSSFRQLKLVQLTCAPRFVGQLKKCWKNWSVTAWLVCYILTALTSFSKLIFKQKSQKMSLFS